MRLFTTDETIWEGGFYELAIELGPHPDARLEAALSALWQNAHLDGCYLSRNLEPTDQQPVQPSLSLLEQYGHLFGVATLPDGNSVACGCVAIREEEGSDWLDFYLPMGALSTAYDVGSYPFDDGKDSHHWREPLDGRLVELAQAVFAVTSFTLALVGHEVSGYTRATDLAITGIPAERWDGYLWREADKLTWYPPTNYSAPIKAFQDEQDGSINRE